MANKANLEMPKRNMTVNLYRVRTRCGFYGGVCVVAAFSAEEALELTNDLVNGQNCREIAIHNVTLVYEDISTLETGAFQVWDGNI